MSSKFPVPRLQADWRDHSSLVASLKHVDVVISTLAGTLEELQMKLIDAIKDVGHIKASLDNQLRIPS